jgi:AcrR family transcriptional regulator
MVVNGEPHMSPRKPDPEIGARLVEVAARLLAEDGPAGVSARRVATEAGASTMAVYTHFGSMDELLATVRREGYYRFGVALERFAPTADPVADLMAQGWAYRAFALQQEHLYRVMFEARGSASFVASAKDQLAAMATFESLTGRLQACVDAQRFLVDDVQLAGEVVWAGSHGHAMIELGGYHRSLGRDPRRSFAESLLRMAHGFGDKADRAMTSATKARSRAKRAALL